MVAVDERGPGPGARGKLSSDRAVEAAAVALLHGLDPIQYLSYTGDDFRLIEAILRRAHEKRNDELKWFADYVSERTSGLTAKHITRWAARSFGKK